MKKISTTQQQGFVSIIVALIIIIFVSLMGLGFAFMARQNQVQNQNRLLSTQAFYAAESAVNDATKYLKDSINSGNVPADKTNCTDNLGKGGAVSSSNPDIKYTCVLYSVAPTSLEYVVSDNESTVVRVQPQDGANIQSITISWQDGQDSKQFATNNQHYLPQKNSGAVGGDDLAASTGILRTTVIPAGSGNLSRDSLTKNTQTLMLYPKGKDPTSQSTQSYISDPNNVADANQAVFSDGNCNLSSKPKYCSVTINNLGAASSNVIYLRLRSLYRPSSSVTITAKTNSPDNAKLVGEQALIDATGKAANVLRRIQVRVPLVIKSNRPEFAVESMDTLCKRLQVWPGGASVDAAAIGTPDACKIPTN